MVKKNVAGKRDVLRRNVVLVVLFIAVIWSGAAFAFAAFGPSSAWEADVEISGVGYDSEFYTSNEEILALGGFPSPRIVKVDFDGNPKDGHSALHTVSYTQWPNIPLTFPLYSYEDKGMIPKVDFSVGQLFLSDASGNPVADFPGVWEDIDDTTGKMHYYFGFSTAFTGRAILWPCETHDDRDLLFWTVLEPKNSDYLWIVGDGMIPDINEVSLSTTIDLRVTGVGEFQYKGKIENIEVLGDPRARYTMSAASAGVSDTSISSFNADYDWKTAYEVGMAEPLNPDNPVQITYNDIIDGEDENMASVTTGAKLRPGLDGNKGGQAGGGDPFYPGGPLSFAVDDITVYNVELIYDFLCDVTLNGIPLTAKGDWLSGRVDEYFIPPKDPEPFGFDLFWLVVIAVAAIFVLNEGSKRRTIGIKLE